MYMLYINYNPFPGTNYVCKKTSILESSSIFSYQKTKLQGLRYKFVFFFDMHKNSYLSWNKDNFHISFGLDLRCNKILKVRNWCVVGLLKKSCIKGDRLLLFVPIIF